MEYLYKDLTAQVIGAAIKVHKELGPGFPEKIYQRALDKEFIRQQILYVREKRFNVFYEGKNVGYETVDFCIDDKVIIELKATREILDIHATQVIGYLKATKLRLGLVLNFGKSKLEIKRIIL